MRTRLSWQWLGLFCLLVVGLGVLGLTGRAAEFVPAPVFIGAASCVSLLLILLVFGGIRNLLEAAESVHRKMTTGSACPIAFFDTEGRCLGGNRAARDIGWTRSHGKYLHELLPPQACEAAEHAMRRALNAVPAWFDVDIEDETGRVSWRVSLNPSVARDGALRYVTAVLMDVASMKAVESDLRRKLDQRAVLLDNVDTQIWYLTDPQTYGAANRAHAEFVGLRQDELIGRNIYDITGQKTAPVCIDGNAEAFENGTPVRTETQIEDSDGEKRYLSIVKVPKLRADGQVDHVVCTAQDVTEHMQAEAGLRMQTSAINAASDQIIITDAQGRIEFANPAFESETGYKFEEIAGKNPRFLKSDRQDVAFYALLWNTILNGRTWHGEVTNRRKDGTTYVAQMTITPVKNEHGRIERFVAINRNITEKKLFEQRMNHLAHHDLLTGLPNRLMMSHRLTHSVQEASRGNGRVAVLFLDLDGFKLINDTMGHKTGDELLKTVADRLMHCCKDTDTLSRMGGDEFVIVLPQVTGPEQAAKVARRVMKTLSKPFNLDGTEVFVSASIGISMYPVHGDDVEALVKNADAAMYYAKEQGRAGYYFYGEELNAAAAERMALENQLRRAIERQEFVVYYQPRVDVATGKILGAEALVRWRHPELGLVYPDRFVPIAEETGLIVPISEWVLKTACAQNKAWQDAGLPPIDVAVNISARQFQRKNTLSQIKSILKDSGLDPNFLEIELTESTLMRRPEAAAEVLNKLKAMGIHIAVDDFGTGYSSLSYLKKFPVDALKIDRSFVGEITTNADDAAITKAVIAMAHSLNLKVVAEGVETLEQLQFLYELGCDEMQGYFVSAAVAPEELVRLLSEGDWSQDQTPLAA